VLAITDSPAAPVARLANDVLVAPARHPVLPGSLSAAVVAIEALATALMVASRTHVGKARRLTAATADYLSAADDPAS
jgi:DNA-binding MurR/RpiR family transcriptional regulator